MRPAISLTLTSFRSPASTVAQVPAPFAPGDWSVADAPASGAVNLAISALPADGGAAILDIEFQVDGGVWVPGGLNAPGSIAVSGLTDGQSYSFALRARNGAGSGAGSGAKPWIVHDTTAPTIASVTLNQASDSFDLAGVSEAGTFFGLIDTGAAAMSGSAIEAAVLGGTAPAQVSFPVVSGANTATIDKSGVAPGAAYFHATIKDASGNYALDVPFAFTQPAGAPPPANAAPAVRSSAATAGPNGPTIVVSMPAGVVVGDDLLVAIGHKNSVTGSAPGWALIASQQISSGTLRTLSLWKRTADGTEGAGQTFTFTGWGSYSAVAVAMQDTASLGVPVTATGPSSTTYTGPTVTVAANGAALNFFLQLNAISGAGLVTGIDGGSESVAVVANTGLGAGPSPSVTVTASGGASWAGITLEALQ